jgi:hypothetical protein
MSRRAIEDAAVGERVIAANANDQMGRVLGQLLQLAGNIPSRMAVNRQKRDGVLGGELTPHLIDDGGAVARVPLIVKHGITEQHQMVSAVAGVVLAKLFVSSWRCSGRFGSDCWESAATGS